MFKSRTLGAAAILSLLMSLALAATVTAAGKVPQGQGLITTTDLGITLECSDPSITEFITGGGGSANGTAGWRHVPAAVH